MKKITHVYEATQGSNIKYAFDLKKTLFKSYFM